MENIETTTTIIENEIPIETLFKYALKERKKAIKALDRMKEDYEYLKKENDRLRKKVPAYNQDGSFVSQKNYETMALERSKAIEDRDICLSRLYAKENEIYALRKDIAKKDTELAYLKGRNLFQKIFC